MNEECRTLENDAPARGNPTPADVEAAASEVDRAIIMAISFAGDTVKRWYAQLMHKEVVDIFPDGLDGFTGDIKVETKDNRLDQPAGWKLRLDVVGANYKLNTAQFKQCPEAMRNVAVLMRAAHLFLMHAITEYNLPNDGNWLATCLAPTEYGTLYIAGWPRDTTPMLGVIATPL